MDAPTVAAQAESHFSWLREILVPAFFTVIGAAVGFLASQIRDERVARHAKQSFLRAIAMELDSLGGQLDASLLEVQDSRAGIESRHRDGVQLAWSLRTSVFTSQVAKLRDVDDPLMIELIHFYSDLGTLERVFAAVNQVGSEFSRADVPSGEREGVRPRLLSTLTAAQLQLRGFSQRLKTLKAKLAPPTS